MLDGDKKRPNIIVILTDQHRADALEMNDDSPVESPNLRKLAQGGTTFEATWCSSPVCQPSRASLVTGMYPSEHGLVQNLASDFDPEWPTFMRQLQRAGYRTANIGKTHYLGAHDGPVAGSDVHVNDSAQQIAAFGFDDVLEEFDQHVHMKPGFTSPYLEYLDQEGLRTEYTKLMKSVMPFTEGHWRGTRSSLPEGSDQTAFLADAAVRWIEERDRDVPFFLQLSFVQPHSPLIAQGRWMDHYEGVDVGTARGIPVEGATPEWEEHLADLRKRSQTGCMLPTELEKARRAYFGMISMIDEGIGRVVEALERCDLRESTWILYSSDHGEMLGDQGLMGKACFYRPSVRVPLIISPAPEQSAKTRVDHGIAQLVDVGATVLDIAGTPPIERSRGRSLVSRTMGRASAGWPIAVSEIGSYGKTDTVFRAVTDGVRRLTVDLVSGRACEVFDLHTDPDELENLVGTAAGRVIESELRELMRRERLPEIARLAKAQAE
ncbi:sulfatase [Microbacterium sp. AGC85]